MSEITPPEQPRSRRRATIVGIVALAAAVVVAVVVAVTVVLPGSSPTAGTATSAAGTTSTPQPSATRAATPTPAPTPTAPGSAAPTPAPTPGAASPAPALPGDPGGAAEDPSDPSTWTIRFDGVGPVTIGVPMEDQRAVLPDFTDITDPSCTEYYLDLEAPTGFSILLLGGAAQPQTTSGVTFGNGGGTGPETAATTPRTPEGIGIDSTLDDLLAAYPGIEKTGMYQSDDYPYYGITDGQGAWIVFALLQGKVGTIQIANEAVLPPENRSVKTIPSERCPA